MWHDNGQQQRCVGRSLQSAGYIPQHAGYGAEYFIYRPRLEPETSEPSIGEYESPQQQFSGQQHSYDDSSQSIDDASVCEI